jgi:hypothetical protein
MMVLDAGAFIAADRNDRAMWRRLKAAVSTADGPMTATPVLAQVWRADARQAQLARLIRATESSPLSEAAALAVGALLARAGTSDVVDAALVLAAVDGDVIYTSDPHDVAHLARTRGLHVDIVPV